MSSFLRQIRRAEKKTKSGILGGNQTSLIIEYDNGEKYEYKTPSPAKQREYIECNTSKESLRQKTDKILKSINEDDAIYSDVEKVIKENAHPIRVGDRITSEATTPPKLIKISKGTKFYRSVNGNENTYKWRPPKNVIKEYGRFNVIEENVFYLSFLEKTARSEINSNYINTYEVIKDFYVISAYADFFGNFRSLNSWEERVTRRVNKFYNNLMTLEHIDGDHIYWITNILKNDIFNKNNLSEQDLNKDNVIGYLYPSVKMKNKKVGLFENKFESNIEVLPNDDSNVLINVKDIHEEDVDVEEFFKLIKVERQ